MSEARRPREISSAIRAATASASAWSSAYSVNTGAGPLRPVLRSTSGVRPVWDRTAFAACTICSVDR